MKWRLYWTVRLTPEQCERMRRAPTQVIYLWYLLRKTAKQYCSDDDAVCVLAELRIKNLIGQTIWSYDKRRLWFTATVPTAKMLLGTVPRLRRWKKRRKKRSPE
jgi:hypothetical protein